MGGALNQSIAEQQSDLTPSCTHSASDTPTVLSDIYQSNINLAIWQRELAPQVQSCASKLIETYPTLKKTVNVSPSNAIHKLGQALDGNANEAFLDSVAQLVDMFCCLFDLDEVGLRLTVLNGAMCPRFHVDHVPCRLVTTYYGAGSEWLPNEVVDRSKLGHGSNGLADDQSGLYRHLNAVQQLKSGDVALLKGERWIGNDNNGVVHRSPSVASDHYRLLLTLDFA